MTNEELQQLKKELIEGHSMLWDKLFLKYYDNTVDSLMRQFGCGKEIAYDCYIEAHEKFRYQVLKDKFQPTSLKGYLWTIAKNIYLKQPKATKPLFDNTNNQEDEEKTNEVHNQEKYIAFKNAWTQLSQKCQNLLQLFYYDGRSMKELTKLLEMNSEDVVKNAKYRCLKKLKTLTNDFLEQT